jgi:type IV secretory pathway VirB10-like protein
MVYGVYMIDTRLTRVVRWGSAAMIVIAIHTGATIALLHPREDDDADVAGAIAIELAPLTAAPAVTSADIAPGPLMQEEAPAPEARKQTKVTVAEETPPLEPAPLAPEPAVQLPEPQPDRNEKPQEKTDEKVAHEEDSRHFRRHCAITFSTLSACLASTLRVEAQPGRTAELRDPYARWCGRGGAARRPPIPIIDP